MSSGKPLEIRAVWLRGYCYIYLLYVGVAMTVLFSHPTLLVMVESGTYLLSGLGIWGLAHRKRIFTRLFWVFWTIMMALKFVWYDLLSGATSYNLFQAPRDVRLFNLMLFILIQVLPVICVACYSYVHPRLRGPAR
ncbi:MAG: hypothetical protein H6756_00950 [Candidatus Omnitrophica bacterium]|nr:hypothetical protein [Candidatus Omnitrophota bacterium]